MNTKKTRERKKSTVAQTQEPDSSIGFCSDQDVSTSKESHKTQQEKDIRDEEFDYFKLYLPNTISMKEKKNRLSKKYGIPSKSSIVRRCRTTGQEGNDCVVISVKTAEALIYGKNPCDWIYQSLGQVYRKTITSELLRSTKQGRKILTHFHDDISEIQKAFHRRDIERKKQREIFRLRNNHQQTHTTSTRTKKSLQKQSAASEEKINKWIATYTQKFDDKNLPLLSEPLEEDV